MFSFITRRLHARKMERMSIEAIMDQVEDVIETLDEFADFNDERVNELRSIAERASEIADMYASQSAEAEKLADAMDEVLNRFVENDT